MAHTSSSLSSRRVAVPVSMCPQSRATFNATPSPYRAPPHPSTRKHPRNFATLYVDNNAVPAAYVDLYGGQRLWMRGTVMGREARRASPYVTAERGPHREHVRPEPLSGIAVLVRSRGDGRSQSRARPCRAVVRQYSPCLSAVVTAERAPLFQAATTGSFAGRAGCA